MSRLTIAALPAAALALAVTLSPLASRVSHAQPAGVPGASYGAPVPAAPQAPDAFQPPIPGAPASGAVPEGGGAPTPPRFPTPGPAQPTPVPVPPIPPTPPVSPTPPVPPTPPTPLSPLSPLSPLPPLPPLTPPVPPIPHAPSDAVPGDDSLTNHHFDADFTGGVTASVVAEFLSREVPGLNVLLPNNAGEIVMPDMQLKNVNMREFMAAITAASNVDMANGNPGYSLTPVPGAPNIVIFQRLQPVPAPYGPGGGMGGGMAAGGAVPGVPGAPGMGGMGLGGVEGGGGGSVPGIYGTLGGGGILSTPAPHTPPGKKETLFFDLSGILKSKELKVDDITTAIRTAWSALESGKLPPEGAIRFHQETRLLIVTAAPDYMRSASAIVNLLLERTRPSRDEREQEVNALQQQIRMSEDRRAQAENERRVEEERIREVRDKLQSRITELELELLKLRQQQESAAARRQ